MLQKKNEILDVFSLFSSETTNTNEFVKSSDAPGGSSYVLRTSAYRTFYSDYVEVEPGEEVFGEIHVKTISGSGFLGCKYRSSVPWLS